MKEGSPQRGPPADARVDITSSGTKTHTEESNRRCEWRPERPVPASRGYRSPSCTLSRVSVGKRWAFISEAQVSGVKMQAQQATASLHPGCSLYEKVQLLQFIAQELPQMVQQSPIRHLLLPGRAPGAWVWESWHPDLPRSESEPINKNGHNSRPVRVCMPLAM